FGPPSNRALGPRSGPAEGQRQQASFHPYQVIPMLNPGTPADRGGTGGSLSFRLRVAGGLGGLVLLAAVLAGWLGPTRTPPAPALDEEDAEQVLAVVNPGYVGIEACAECHTRRAADFKTTRHYLACRTATGVAAPGFAPERGRYDTRVPGLHFEMTRAGD